MDWRLHGSVCVLGLLFLFISVSARMKRGKYDFLESFCTGPEVYVAIPWDCSGYVHCANLGSQRDAYWIECPTNLYYSMEAQTCMWPKDMRKPCPPLKGKFFIIPKHFLTEKIRARLTLVDPFQCICLNMSWKSTCGRLINVFLASYCRV